MKKFIKSIVAYFDDAIIQPDDPDDVKLGKRIFVRLNLFIPLGSISGIAQGIVGGSEGVVAIATLSGILFPLNFILLRRTKLFSVHLSIFSILVILVAFSWGVINGGFVNNFALYALPLMPLMLIILVFNQRQTVKWLLGLVGILVIFSILDPYVDNPANVSGTAIYDNTSTIISATIIVFLTINYYKRAKNTALHLLGVERERSETLLLNILPKKIAEMLKVEERTIAEQYDSASILFADMVGFTSMSTNMNPSEMVDLLNKIYSHFDTLSEKYGVEKILTIGDSYMAASGVPSKRLDHAQALASMALDMLEYSKEIPAENGKSIKFRVGINSGPLVAGVIGQKKFRYDVWGDTVNTASRMESNGRAGKIQITRSTYELLKDEFLFDSRGEIDVKGKGQMETWYLVGRK